MADTQASGHDSSKLAMSRALGAAFLNHQVQELEKTFNNGNGPASGNWRDRRQAAQNGSMAPSSPRGIINFVPAKRAPPETTNNIKPAVKGKNGSVLVIPSRGRESVESSTDEKAIKDADVIVVDASVLIHALYKVRRWCREGRQEIVIVPLEALNTLDLLKKGTTLLAQRARAASRILEAQVGTNPRIRVQRDDAFVPWDKINLSKDDTSPEWVRRIICCARYELDHATTLKQDSGALNSATAIPTPRVVLAVLGQTAGSTSPMLSHAKLAGSDVAPVPLPLAHHANNKHEPRATGSLVAHWAARVDIKVLEITPTTEDENNNNSNNNNSTNKRSIAIRSARRSPPRNIGGSSSAPGTGLVERPPAVKAMMEMVAQPSKVVRVLARGEKLDPDP